MKATQIGERLHIYYIFECKKSGCLMFISCLLYNKKVAFIKRAVEFCWAYCARMEPPHQAPTKKIAPTRHRLVL